MIRDEEMAVDYDIKRQVIVLPTVRVTGVKKHNKFTSTPHFCASVASTQWRMQKPLTADKAYEKEKGSQAWGAFSWRSA